MVASADFGIVIPAAQEHLHWVRGACASIRHFMDDTPICVLLDGEHFPADLRSYGVSVLFRDEVEPRELHDLSFGSLRAKNAALWASPYETFLLLDADTVVWGDMRSLADFERFDFVLDRVGVEPTRYVMDAEAVATHRPEFDVRRHLGSFVNTGVYFGRRGALDLDRYLELIRFSQANPGMFFGSQGLLNFMVFGALDAGEVRVQQREVQVMTGRTMREEVVRRFALVESGPVVTGDPVVLHWAGSAKPRVTQRGRDYFEPMTHFRREFRRATRRSTTAHTSDDLHLRLEDALCADWRGANLRGRLARVRRRSRKRYARYKVTIRRRTPDWVVATVRRRAAPLGNREP